MNTTKNKHVILLSLLNLMGSGLIILGTFIPWISFLGGLQTFSGISGLNGRILLGSGSLTLCLGMVFIMKKVVNIQWIIGILGFLQLAFCSYLLLNLYQTFTKLSGDPMNSMMVGGIGPGLFITTFGSLMVFATFFIPLKNLEETSLRERYNSKKVNFSSV